MTVEAYTEYSAFIKDYIKDKDIPTELTEGDKYIFLVSDLDERSYLLRSNNAKDFFRSLYLTQGEFAEAIMDVLEDDPSMEFYTTFNRELLDTVLYSEKILLTYSYVDINSDQPYLVCIKQEGRVYIENRRAVHPNMFGKYVSFEEFFEKASKLIIENYRYEITSSDLIGGLEGIPLDMAQLLIDIQMRQGNPPNIKALQENICATRMDEGFTWEFTKYPKFWYLVLAQTNPKAVEEILNDLNKQKRKDMVDIVQLIKGKERNLPLYSSVVGPLICSVVNAEDEIECRSLSGFTYYFSKYGVFLPSDASEEEEEELKQNGECTLFPSKDNRSWENFRVDLPIGTPVMVGGASKIGWSLRYYAGDSHVFVDGFKSGVTTITSYYIIPCDKFNFSDISFNPEDNYGEGN